MLILSPSLFATASNNNNAKSVRLRALTLGMNHPVKCSEYWGEIAEQELNRLGLPYETWDEAQLLKYRPELNIQKFDM